MTIILKCSKCDCTLKFAFVMATSYDGVISVDPCKNCSDTSNAIASAALITAFNSITQKIQPLPITTT
jgi:hypothetical protein